MKPLYDTASVMRTLQQGIIKGYWTLEDLDTPAKGYVGDPAKHRNLLRDSQPPQPDDLPF